ncbi:MAG: hypothetical protein UT33_C0019G0002 [Candidatus Peregrinibacteria bacterium GW2011_GWC2_39_14]|nr:MAG: hypothetical protein US92_C0012G0002 [Candidatus Peregrinibacteria bacterium GW2011_GWA2_38_36]KKR04553.1 MAG: hypothetical protein UT33_C0019G0002 [Candidatus Peregrinibacteria bacterium GW2011_GWC2_39_14]
MKKYYFVNFTVVIALSDQKFMHMSILSTDKAFFPIIQAKNNIKETFDKDIGQETNIIFNNFQEVPKESFDEFHNGFISEFAEL